MKRDNSPMSDREKMPGDGYHESVGHNSYQDKCFEDPKDGLTVECAWCGKTLREGTGKVSYGMCPDCYKKEVGMQYVECPNCLKSEWLEDGLSKCPNCHKDIIRVAGKHRKT